MTQECALPATQFPEVAFRPVTSIKNPKTNPVISEEHLAASTEGLKGVLVDHIALDRTRFSPLGMLHYLKEQLSY